MGSDRPPLKTPLRRSNRARTRESTALQSPRGGAFGCQGKPLLHPASSWPAAALAACGQGEAGRGILRYGREYSARGLMMRRPYTARAWKQPLFCGSLRLRVCRGSEGCKCIRACPIRTRPSINIRNQHGFYVILPSEALFGRVWEGPESAAACGGVQAEAGPMRHRAQRARALCATMPNCGCFSQKSRLPRRSPRRPRHAFP